MWNTKDHSDWIKLRIKQGKQLKKLRLAKKIGLRELGRNADLTHGQVMAIEQGKTNYKHDSFNAYVVALGCIVEVSDKCLKLS